MFLMLLFADEMPKVVEVEKATRKNITQTIKLIGTVKAKSSMVLIAKTQGVLDQTTNAGEKITKGSIIAKIENADLEKNYALSENAEKIAKSQYDRAQNLQKSNAISKKEFEDYQNKWINAQKDLAKAKIELDRTRFIAPFDGVVGVFKVREGAQVQPGNAIVTFYNPTEIIVEFDIPKHMLKKMNDQQKVIIDKAETKIEHVQMMIDDDTHMSPAFVDIKNDAIIGDNVDVAVVMSEKNNVIVVPFDAVFMKEGKTNIYVVKDNKAVLTPVELGVREHESVEIVEGVNVDDLVIIKGQERLYPDALVKVHEV